MYNLYRESPVEIFLTCNIFGKLIDNYAKMLSPNCYQVVSNPNLEITSANQDQIASLDNPKAKIVELTNSTHQIADPSYRIVYDPTSSGEVCEVNDQEEISRYWGEVGELPDFVKDRVSSLKPFQKELYFNFAENVDNTDYLETHIFNLESHLHIILTLIVLSGLKMIFMKIFELTVNCAKSMKRDELDSDFKNELKPLNKNNTKPIINAPSSPQFNMYPNPPMM